jgi:hypothetical protein
MKAALLLLMLAIPHTAPAIESPRVPVVVELFTSEGCSSCPPADTFLRQLDKTQPVPGAEVIILSQHVDYWNHLGWTDPYSSKDFTKRQEAYATVMHTDGPYTPQMIVDGCTEFNGTDVRKAREAIAQAAATPKATVTITPAPTPEGERLQIHVDGADFAKVAGKADVMLAITENALSNSVTKGENAGHNLSHNGVVRRLTQIGTATKAGFTAEQVVVFDKAWKRENLRAVVFLQDRNSRRVFGAAEVGL